MPPIRAKNRAAWMKEYNARQNARKRLGQKKAARVIQRKWRKTRKVNRRPISYGTEIYQFRLATQSTTLSQNAGSGILGPKNSVILLPAFFSQHTTSCDSNGTAYLPSGSWLKPVYSFTTKVRVSFENITNHADNKAGLNLRCIHGMIKVPISKAAAGSGWGSQALFEAQVLTVIKENLYESNVVSDPLEYSQKNRNVHIAGRFDVKPNRNNMIRVDSLVHTNAVPSTTDTISSATYPPPKVYTIKHVTPPNKTRLAFTADSAKFPVPEQLWLPFTMFACPQLTSNSGHFNIDHSSRMYYTDN